MKAQYRLAEQSVYEGSSQRIGLNSEDGPGDGTVDGDEDETLVADTFNLKPDTWYWMMLEVIGDEMVAQVSGAPVLRAKHPRFNIPKDQINLPTRGGGIVLYDNVKVWNAVQKK